ncbi:MAG: hypothetical protein Q9182_006832 [Xanthomendoza sp. 2 TL-2023]
MDPTPVEADTTSNYGSDFTPDEEEILHSLLHEAPAATLAEGLDLALKDINDNETPRGARISRRSLYRQQWYGSNSIRTRKQASRVTPEMADDGSIAANVESTESRQGRENHERFVSIEAPIDPPSESPSVPAVREPDLRSPLERFRTKPKKALSVTDLVSPSWCELQYWFTLTKHGKKRRTPAMKQGTVVHKILEEEVHQTVAVDIQTREDAWGLRIWNIIQGLRTLRETGMTRELEVWGVFDGLVVNGVIDELSYNCPDRELEAAELETNAPPPPLPPDQRSISDFLSPNGSQALSQNNFGIAPAQLSSSSSSGKGFAKVYITDTKTRSVKSIPKAASFRPTLMQLMLYHRLLSDMATNMMDPSVLFSRYDLRPDEPFTDAFIAQVSGTFNAAPSMPSQNDNTDSSTFAPDMDQDTLHLLLSHNSLSQLWTLMISDFHATFPEGAQSVGKVLKADYRDAVDGHLIGDKTVLMDEGLLTKYLKSELGWWRGERPAEGVCLEEAYKCRSCDFAEECGWRKGKIEEAREKMRMMKGRGVSMV